MLDKYTKTLCTAQKKTSLESSLLQDIPMLNGQDSSQLEDWLTDIETASELTLVRVGLNWHRKNQRD